MRFVCTEQYAFAQDVMIKALQEISEDTLTPQPIYLNLQPVSMDLKLPIRNMLFNNRAAHWCSG